MRGSPRPPLVDLLSRHIRDWAAWGIERRPKMAVASTRHLVTLTAAAQHAACSSKTIRRRIAAGELTGYRLGSRLIRVDLDELDALLRPIPTTGRAS